MRRALDRAIPGAIFGALFGVLLLGVGAIRIIIALVTGKPISFDEFGAGIVSLILAGLIMWLEHDHDLWTNAIVVSLMTISFGTFAGYKIHHWDGSS